MKFRHVVVAVGLSVAMVAAAAVFWTSRSSASLAEQAEVEAYIAEYLSAISQRDVDQFYSLAGSDFRSRCTLSITRQAFEKFPPPTYSNVKVVRLALQGDEATADVSFKVSAGDIYDSSGDSVFQHPARQVVESYTLTRTDTGWTLRVTGEGCPMASSVN